MEESEPLNPNATHRFTKLSQDSRSCYHCGRDIFNVLHITAMEPGDVLETPDGVSKVTMDYWDEKQPVTRVIQIKLSNLIFGLVGAFILGPAIRVAIESAFGAN